MSVKKSADANKSLDVGAGTTARLGYESTVASGANTITVDGNGMDVMLNGVTGFSLRKERSGTSSQAVTLGYLYLSTDSNNQWPASGQVKLYARGIPENAFSDGTISVGGISVMDEATWEYQTDGGMETSAAWEDFYFSTLSDPTSGFTQVTLHHYGDWCSYPSECYGTGYIPVTFNNSTTARNRLASVSFGQYPNDDWNKLGTRDILKVGNGSSAGSTSNAFALDETGRMWFQNHDTPAGWVYRTKYTGTLSTNVDGATRGAYYYLPQGSWMIHAKALFNTSTMNTLRNLESTIFTSPSLQTAPTTSNSTIVGRQRVYVQGGAYGVLPTWAFIRNTSAVYVMHAMAATHSASSGNASTLWIHRIA